MTAEPGAVARPTRRGPMLAWLGLFAIASTLSGCRFLADEFAWLDRAAPGATRAPDAPVSGLDERP